MLLETISRDPVAIHWFFTAIQILGILSMVGARMNEGSLKQSSFHRMFFICLVLVGASTMVALGLGSGYWVTCSITLAIMILGATLDLGSSQRAATF